MSLTDSLSPENKEALRELRKAVGDDLKPELKNDISMFLRFLRARDFVVHKSEEMLRNHIVWRKAYQIDNLLEDFTMPEVGVKYFPLTRFGHDKDGAPIRYFAFGNMDMKGLLKSQKKVNCMKSILHCLECDVADMKVQSATLGRRVEQWVYIFDFENYSFSRATHKPSLELLIQVFMMYEANYPERLKAAYIVNASVYFTILFAIIKPLLSGATLKKVKIFGKEGWKEELLRNIDPNVLPAFLGGDRTDPDGNTRCSTIVKHGGMVPEEYYISKSGISILDKPGVKKINVSRMAKAQVVLDVAEGGSCIEWEFEMESKDIGFGLYYKAVDAAELNAEELIPKQRMDTHLASETGMYRCDSPGIYILEFDNSYSWLQQKEIYCRAVVVTPSGEQVTVLE